MKIKNILASFYIFVYYLLELNTENLEKFKRFSKFKLATVRPKKRPNLPSFLKNPLLAKKLLGTKPLFGGYLTVFFYYCQFRAFEKKWNQRTARFRYLGKKIKDPPVLGICGQIYIKEPPVLLFQERTKELVVLGGDLSFFYKKPTWEPCLYKNRVFHFWYPWFYIRIGYLNFLITMIINSDTW